MLQDKEKTERLLQEDGRIKTERDNLQSRLKRLRKARILLTNFSMDIYNFQATAMIQQDGAMNGSVEQLTPHKKTGSGKAGDSSCTDRKSRKRQAQAEVNIPVWRAVVQPH